MNTRLIFFNQHIAAAQAEIAERNECQSRMVRGWCVTAAAGHLREALIIANQMQDGARKALCMRVLNWLRADIRRAA